MGARQAGTEEVTGGELRGGRWFGSRVGFGLQGSLVEAEVLGSSARLWGDSWWRWIGGGSSGCDEWHWIAAATELAGDEEERTFPDDCWLREHYGVDWGCLSARRSTRPPYRARRRWLRGGG